MPELLQIETDTTLRISASVKLESSALLSNQKKMLVLHGTCLNLWFRNKLHKTIPMRKKYKGRISFKRHEKHN